jgi:hypothetical protein
VHPNLNGLALRQRYERLNVVYTLRTIMSCLVQLTHSEQALQQITAIIDEVNNEIKGYISVHKKDLMAGMCICVFVFVCVCVCVCVLYCDLSAP